MMILRKTHGFKLLGETVEILTTYNKSLPKNPPKIEKQLYNIRMII